jgi:CubicO group peptidase (beta-lactamase class C family)
MLADVESLFRAQIAERRLHPGAVLAVYHGGRLVLDLWAGLADTQRGVPVGPETLFQLRSTGKPLASVALLQLSERHGIPLDAPAARFWPDFGQHGKQDVTLRHLLTHRGGFADTLGGLHWRQWQDAEAVARVLAELPLQFAPGTASAYHHVTQQWVCAELVQRIDGRAFSDYLREEITGPLGMRDTYIGLPEGLDAHVARVDLTEAAKPESYATVRLLNRPEVWRVPAPAFGVATARDMARFYAALAAGGALDGVRILQPQMVATALAIAVDGEWDRTLGGPVRRGLGFYLSGLYPPEARIAGAASDARTFYHEGAATVLCWGDPTLGVAFAFMANGFRTPRYVLTQDAAGRTTVTVTVADTGVQRDRELSDAVRAACSLRDQSP